MKFSLKNYLPHIAAVAIFAILTLVYFKPLLSGKELNQHDITQHKGMSKEIVDFRNSEHSEPLWTNSMFGGMPAFQISTLYSGNWLAPLDRAFKLYLPHPSGYVFLYFFGFFILLLCLGVDVWLAVIGGIAYGLSSYSIIILGAGHNSKANAIGYLAPLLGGIILTFKGRYWLGAALTVLFMALELNANHVQITYYGFMLIGIVGLTYFYYAFKEKQLAAFGKAVVFISVASIIGVLPNAASLMCTNEYGKYSTRGKTELTINSSLKSNAANTTSGLDRAYATRWSQGIGETFTFLIPDFKGGSSYIAIGESDKNSLKKVSPDFREQVGGMGSYFGDQPGTAGPVYIGAIIIFLAVLGLFIIKHKIKWALIIATFLGMALSWGHNFMGFTNFFMDFVPGYDKFRAVSMAVIIAEFTIPLLAILAVVELLKAKSLQDKVKVAFLKKEIELKKILIIAFALTGGFCAIAYVAPDLVNTFSGQNEEAELVRAFSRSGPEDQVRKYVVELIPQMEIARKALFASDALRSFIFIALAALFLYLFLAKKIKKELMFAALGIFILVDMWTVDSRYLSDKSFISKSQNASQFDKTAADEEILKDPALDYRVLNLSDGLDAAFNESKTSYWHKSIGGYHGAKLKKYAELIEFHIDKDIQRFVDGFYKSIGNDSAIVDLTSQLGTLNMLNTKYFIMPGGKEGRDKIPFKNPSANGNAWFVKQVKTVVNADSEIVGLYNINTKTQAITQEKFKNDVKLASDYSADGSIKLLSYKANDLVYESDSKEAQFAVFSEIYYPKGWNAYVDGQLNPHIAVNYVLRGMPIPAGKHTIEFKFEPAVYKTGNTISMAGSILVLASVALCLYLDNKKNKAA